MGKFKVTERVAGKDNVSEDNQASEISQSRMACWAKVEVMGHQSHVGFVRTEAYGQAVLFRIDTPELPEREYVLTEPEYVKDDGPGVTWAPAGAKVRREATPGVTVLVGALLKKAAKQIDGEREDIVKEDPDQFGHLWEET